MKTYTTNHNNDTVRFCDGKNSKTWRSLALAALVLLPTVSYSSAQSLSSSKRKPMTYSPTTCWVSPTGGNGCMSPQYRSGAYGSAPGSTYNANLTGNPVGDKNVLNPQKVNSSSMGLLTSIESPWVAAGNTQGGCQPSNTGGQLLPTASVSVESRILFPALDANGNCALFTYDVTYPSDAQYVAELGTTNPHVTASPGYNGDVVIGAEDGNVYSYEWASTTLDWTFTDPYPGWGFDSSPTTWPGLAYVYVVDTGGNIFYLNPGNGQAAFTINSPINPGGNNVVPVSASSLAVSTASNMVFLAGTDAYGNTNGDEVCAYNATTAASAWTACQTFSGNLTAQNNLIGSSPVVSDSLGLVFVTDQPQYLQGTNSTNLYALEVNNNGTVRWNVSLIPTPGSPWDSYSPLPYGGSPAYDDSANNGSSKYVITVSPYSCYYSYGHGYPCGEFSAIQVFNALNGNLVCSGYTSHIISQSSPEVVDGVIYVGTDDGYVLAYDETKCSSGSLPNIWTSSTGNSCGSGPCPMDSPLEGPPVVSYNRIHAVSENGTLYVWNRCDAAGCW